ncbi:Hypothetical predicted protein [Paramuricea clavata]|uniref:DUF1758 domain-containing protein n=1 Tax=Paramuricea clavata TaxID=317549 RepID=A0A6S7ISN1_PARCT|nr:Hypothetical predicted protein [Paramuricea clavata]
MSEEATKKRKIRGGHRSSTKRTINASSTILDDFDPSNKQLTEKLLQQKITLKENLDILQNLDNDILAITEEKDIEKEIEESDLLRERIHPTIVRIDSIVSPMSLPPSPSPEGTKEEGNNHNSSTISHSSAKIKLPKLSLKKFKGDIKEWIPFWDSYTSAIHDNPDLSDIDKFNYLNSLLESKAAEAIAGLKITSANYQEAVDVLNQRFGDKQQIINSHMDSLLRLPAVTSLHDVQSIRQLYNKVESHIRGLKSLGVETARYGNLMISILMQRLPPGLRIIVTKKMQEDEWSLDKLMTIFRQELEARERANLQCLPSSKSSYQRNKPGTAAALFTGLHNTTCSYCQGKHLSANCKTVTNVAARRDILKRSGWCFVCLRKKKISRECQSNIKCFKCGRRHHGSMYMGGQPRQQHQQATTSQTMYVGTRTSILLQTAKVNIYNPGMQENRVNARLILDSGSQRSFVTTRVKNQLNLDAEGTENLMIKTFGGEAEELQTCEFLHFNIEIESTYPDLSLTVFVVPTIYQPLRHQTTQAAQEIYHHLEGLNLADLNTGEEELEVDILVGSDQYWNLITGAVRRGDSGPNAMGTKVGWVLYGPVTDPVSEKNQC